MSAFHPSYSPIPNKLDLTWSRDDLPVCSLTATHRGTAGEALTVGHWRAASVHFGVKLSQRTGDITEKWKIESAKLTIFLHQSQLSGLPDL